MPDITMCEGMNCPHKEACYRYTATPSEFMQSYFMNSPIEESGRCTYYWGENGEAIWNLPNSEVKE